MAIEKKSPNYLNYYLIEETATLNVSTE